MNKNRELLSTCDDFMAWMYEWYVVHKMNGKRELHAGKYSSREDRELVAIAKRMEHELKRIRKGSPK